MPVADAQAVTYTEDGAVCIPYPVLSSSPETITSSIEKAFGSQPGSLGIIIVNDLPLEYAQYRERLLKLIFRFANLEERVREKYADPTSRYSFGWSHGKEIMNGKPDLLKGSYYANPVLDIPTIKESTAKQYPEYYGLNIWPDRDQPGIEGFEGAFKDLGRFIFRVGCELAAACQPFASPYLLDSSLSLPDLIRTSQTTKARLLHYFPPSSDASMSVKDEPIDSWCGFHLDHSLLTGLCSAIFIQRENDGQINVVPSPSPTSGLYIRTRDGDMKKVSIPAGSLAFQTGEALELATAGKLRATPHCVRVGATQGVEKISRETFALFMQPDTDQKITSEENFGQFSKRIFDEHYENENA